MLRTIYVKLCDPCKLVEITTQLTTLQMVLHHGQPCYTVVCNIEDVGTLYSFWSCIVVGELCIFGLLCVEAWRIDCYSDLIIADLL